MADSRVCIVLSRQTKDFSEGDRHLLLRLSPHLRQAHSNAQLLAQAQHRQRLLERGLNEEGRLVLEVSPEDRVLDGKQEVPAGLRQWFTAAGADWPNLLSRWVREQARTAVAEPEANPPEPLQIESPDDSRLSARFIAGSEQGLVLLTVVRKCDYRQAFAKLSVTAQEREVLGWICEGKTNPEIATILSLCARTVHKHVQHIFEKLGLENRHQAQRLGWELLQKNQTDGL